MFLSLVIPIKTQNDESLCYGCEFWQNSSSTTYFANEVLLLSSMQYYFFFLTLWFRMKVNHSWASATLGVVYKFGGYKEKAVKEVDTSRMGH